MTAFKAGMPFLFGLIFVGAMLGMVGFCMVTSSIFRWLSLPTRFSCLAKESRRRAMRSLSKLFTTFSIFFLCFAIYFTVSFGGLSIAGGICLSLAVWIVYLGHYYRVPIVIPASSIADPEAVAISPTHHSPEGSPSRVVARVSLCTRIAFYARTYPKSVAMGARQNAKWIALALLFLIPFCALVPFAFRGACVVAHPNGFSTRFTRSFKAPMCNPGAVCHLYMSVPEDPTTSMIATFHTADSVASIPAPRIYISTTPFPASNPAVVQPVQYLPQSAQVPDPASGAFVAPITLVPGSINYMQNVYDADEVTRYVVHTPLSGLAPNTTYYIRAGYTTVSAGEVITPIFSFTTIHNTTDPIRFVTGGDVETDPVGVQFSTLASAQNPMFIQIGGDLAYENGFATCHRRWDEFLRNMESSAFLSPSGQLVPLLAAIGNHEAGGFNMDASNVEFYTSYFTFTLQQTSQPPVQRSTYHAHRFGSFMHMLSLDTSVIVPHVQQQSFISGTLGALDYSSSPVRMAIYHAPLWPSWRSDEDTTAVDGREAWGALFSQYNVSIGFENHDHFWKRTVPIYNNEQTTTAGPHTVFLGDGSWGVLRSGKPENLWFLAESSSTRHIWVMEATPSGITALAMNQAGQVFDTYTRPL